MDGPPALFGELSKSRDQLPDKVRRYPATEWMNLMLGDSRGVLGELEDFESRQEVFEPGSRACRRRSGGRRCSICVTPLARRRWKVRHGDGVRGLGWPGRLRDPVGRGERYPLAEVGDDLLGPVADQLDKNPEQREAFYGGYRLADRELPDSPGTK